MLTLDEIDGLRNFVRQLKIATKALDYQFDDKESKKILDLIAKTSDDLKTYAEGLGS